MEGKDMRETVTTYLKRHGFRELPWNVWVPDEDWNPAFNPDIWPEIGAKILVPDFALDDLGYIIPNRFSVSQLVLRKMRGGGEGCYWEVMDRFPHHLKLKSFEAACWDAAVMAIVRSVPVTLREDRLWEAAYYRHNRKYVP
jgi:hypothetical protein